MPLSENGSATENTAGSVSFWYDPGKRSILYQVVTLCMVGLLAYYLISNTLANLERQSIATGFGFIQREASFEIGEALIPYSAADSYGRALVVGTLNTLLVSFIGIILTVILGTLIGVARLSSNWLVSKLAAIYTELFQDIPFCCSCFSGMLFSMRCCHLRGRPLIPSQGSFSATVA
jgi:general L-amino acid transport system permease protein